MVLSMCTAQPSLLDLRLLWTDAAPAVALVVAAELGLGVQLVRAGGWLLGNPPGGGFWPPPSHPLRKPGVCLVRGWVRDLDLRAVHIMPSLHRAWCRGWRASCGLASSHASESIREDGIAVTLPNAPCPQQGLSSPLLVLCGQSRSWCWGASPGHWGRQRPSWGFLKNQGGLTLPDFPIVCGLGT